MCRFFTNINLNRGLAITAISIPSLLGIAAFARGDFAIGGTYLAWLIGTVAGISSGYGMKENQPCPYAHVAEDAVANGPVIVVEIEGDGEAPHVPGIQMVRR